MCFSIQKIYISRIESFKLVAKNNGKTMVIGKYDFMHYFYNKFGEFSAKTTL